MDQFRVEVVLRCYWCWQCLGGERQPSLCCLVLTPMYYYIHGGTPDAQVLGSFYGWQVPLAILWEVFSGIHQRQIRRYAPPQPLIPGVGR